MISDTELREKSSKLISFEEYVMAKEKYHMRNPKHYVNDLTHRTIISQSVDIAKNVIAKGGNEDEMKRACLYMRICIDAKQYRLNHTAAKKELKIEELIQKYCQ